jgi:transcriptional regulator with XRE-family HTH domain
VILEPARRGWHSIGRVLPHPAVHSAVKSLDEARLSNRVGIKRLIERAGITERQWRNWKRGTTQPRVADLEACLNVLGLTLAAVPIDYPTSKKENCNEPK